MSFLRKHAWLILISGMLLLLFLLFLPKPDPSLPEFRFSVSSGEETVRVWKAEDGTHRVFLPSFADLDSVTVSLVTDRTTVLGGVELKQGMDCAAFETDTDYELTVGGRALAPLRFCRSEHLGALCIDTATGTLDRIHGDKSYEEEAELRLYGGDGALAFADERITFEGRGNSSWTLEKKPYAIALSQSAELFEMGSSRNWVLLADGYDTSHLHNETVFRFADAVGTFDAFSPDCEQVEVYFNGEYAGLYLLCQKIDESADHLALAKDDFYLEITFASRAQDVSSAFEIGRSRAVDVVYPENCSAQKLEYVEAYILEFQEVLFSEDGIHPTNGKRLEEYIDLDSWARKYLVEEIFANYDAGQASTYFRLDQTDGKLYAGHSWDYDLTFGAVWGTDWFTPYSSLVTPNRKNEQTWFYALYRHEAFSDLVRTLYQTEFRPLLVECAETGIFAHEERILTALEHDRLRWPSLYETPTNGASAEEMSDFLKKRIAYLDSVLLKGEAFSAVTFTMPSGETYNLCVLTGSVCEDLPTPQDFGKSGEWTVAETGEAFDPSLPINEHVTLTVSAQNTVGARSLSLQTLALFCLLFVFFVFFLIVVLVDWRRNRTKKGGRSHG